MLRDISNDWPTLSSSRVQESLVRRQRMGPASLAPGILQRVPEIIDASVAVHATCDVLAEFGKRQSNRNFWIHDWQVFKYILVQ